MKSSCGAQPAAVRLVYPQLWKRAMLSKDSRKALTAKANEPMTLLLRQKGHFVVPNLLPTISAIPSPTAIWQSATALTGDRHPNAVAHKSTPV